MVTGNPKAFHGYNIYFLLCLGSQLKNHYQIQDHQTLFLFLTCTPWQQTLKPGPHTHQVSTLPLLWAKPPTVFVSSLPTRVLIALTSKLKCLNTFELIFMCGMWERSNFIFLLVDLQLSQHYLFMRSFFLHCMTLAPVESKTIESEGAICFQTLLVSISI